MLFFARTIEASLLTCDTSYYQLYAHTVTSYDTEVPTTERRVASMSVDSILNNGWSSRDIDVSRDRPSHTSCRALEERCLKAYHTICPAAPHTSLYRGKSG